MEKTTKSRAETAAEGQRCVEAVAGDVDRAERALAEAFEAGASGAEQRERGDEVTLLLYAPTGRAEAVRAVLARVLGEGAVAEPVAVETRDWSEAWKDGLEPVEVSGRLRIRASFETRPGRPGQRDLVIDPGQAFGTGGHESTRLALAWLDALSPGLGGRHVLDVGSGTGVLALAAVVLGARRATGFDIDPLAGPAAAENARGNALAGEVGFFTGPLDALAEDRRFDGIVANLLRRESEPLLSGLAARLFAQGWLVASGLLAEEEARFGEAAARAGLGVTGVRRATDASGIVWSALLMRPTPPGAT